MNRARPIIAALLLALICNSGATADSVIDSLNFGKRKSERKHEFKGPNSESYQDDNDITARRILPRTSETGEHWRGGRVTFKMKIDPKRQNYFTAQFWGGDVSEEASRLFLFVDGKQLGQRHLGEIDPLDIMGSYPRFPGHFFYKTLPLPIELTRGKTRLEFSIEVHGRIWAYGSDFEEYQRVLRVPSRGLYECFTHTSPFLERMPADQKSNTVERTEGIPKTERDSASGEPGEKVVAEIKRQVNRSLRNHLKPDTVGLSSLQFLANACFEKWTVAYRKKEYLEKVVEGIDAQYLAFEKAPTMFEKEWVGAGPAADAVRILAGPLKFYIDKPIPGTKQLRRKAWTKMFIASRDWHAENRRAYTNQTMIIDLNIYHCNRAIRVLQPKKAWTESKAIRFLHEAVGVIPWSGSWLKDGPVYPEGKRFFQLTKKGLTKELGYVGAYGEIANNLVRDMYEATRPTPSEDGDPKLRQQLVKILKARSVFRYPHVDKYGSPCMRMESVIGWRDWYFPERITYGQLPSIDGGPLDIAMSSGDPELIGYGQQMISDNQFFPAWTYISRLRQREKLNTILRLPRIYDWIQSQPQQDAKLPMSPDQPDFVFADPEVGAVAVKRGDEVLFVSLYWRARFAVNNLARVHYLTPTVEHDVTVQTETRFEESGLNYELPDFTNMGFKDRYEKEYRKEGLSLARAGTVQPIAKIPANVKGFKPGRESIYAGKADFYTMTYGPYFIAMNCHKKRTESLQIPAGFLGAKDLVQGMIVNEKKLRIKARQTMVLYREQ